MTLVLAFLKIRKRPKYIKSNLRPSCTGRRFEKYIILTCSFYLKLKMNILDCEIF